MQEFYQWHSRPLRHITKTWIIFYPLPSKELSESIHANSLSASASVVEKAIGALINKAIARKVTCRGAKSFIKSFSREL